ncbi:MAG TPA: hypothetical protein GX726_03655, partial [Clostridiales bacterium]|nr:hypothetical protein [Clostridiales bacterium]
MEDNKTTARKPIAQFVIIMVTALIIGYLVMVLLNTSKTDYTGGLIPSSQAAGLQRELKDVQTAKAALNEQYLDLEQKLAEIEQSTANNDALVKTLTEEVNKFRIISGYTEVKGPGVIIT